MSVDQVYDREARFHWDHLAGCFFVACVTILAINFDHVFWLYDTALETERLLKMLLLDGVPFSEVFGTAPPGQGLISLLVVIGDSAVDRIFPQMEVTHSVLRVSAASFVTYRCLSALIKDTSVTAPDATSFYSTSLTLLVALGPFALLLSQVGVSTMICLGAAAPLLRLVLALERQTECVGFWEPIYLLIIVAFSGWPGVALALLLCAGCLAQAFLFQDYEAVAISGFSIVLGFGVAAAIIALDPGWPSPALTWVMPHVVLATGIPLVVVAMALLGPTIHSATDNFQWLTLPIIIMLAVIVLALTVGGNLLAGSALLLMAYANIWGLALPCFTHVKNDPCYRSRETVWAIVAWLIGPIAVVGMYALSDGAVWNVRTIGFSALFWVLCLVAMFLFVSLLRNQDGSRWALILTSVGAVLFVGGVASVPMREAYGPAPVALAQQIWGLCRDSETPPAAAQVSAGIDPLTQLRLGPARRSPTDEADVLHIRSAYALAPKGAIDLVQMRQPGHYIAAIAAPSDIARDRCGSN